MNFLDKFKREKPVVLHHGIYKKTESTWSAVFIIVGTTIGAGILGVPYVIAQVGLKIGLLYILILGIVMLFLNLMIGEIAVRTKKPMHLPGFAKRYIGAWAKDIVSLIVLLTGVGVLLAYLIGEGRALSEVFGGNPKWWSMFFWSIGSFLIWRGLQTVKVIEKVASIIILLILGGLSFYLLGFFEKANWEYYDFAKIFLPYGVILLALRGTSAIAEAHALLPGSPGKFRTAVILGSIIPTACYILFAFATVGVLGLGTTEVVTVGLGRTLGSIILVIGNLFAILAMFTSFMGIGIALKQTLVWDHKIKPWLAVFLVVLPPAILFLLGFTDFVNVLDFVGGLFVSVESIFIVFIYWKAKQVGDLDPGKFNLHYGWLLVIPVFLVFTFFTVYSIFRMF